MKKATILLLVLGILLCGCVSEQPKPTEQIPEETVELEHYDYPITSASPEWGGMSVTEKVEALKIPTEQLKDMTDEELIRAMADYPFLIDLHVYGKSTGESIETLRGYCSALDALLSRQSAVAALNDYGRKLADAYGRAAESDSEETGHYEVVEMLLNEIIDYVCGAEE